MNILICNRALGTLFGGGESFDFNSACYLQRRGHQVTLITGKPLWGSQKNTFPGLEVIYIRSPELRRFAYGRLFNEKMKILIVIPSLHRGGAERVVSMLTEEWCRTHARW